MAWQAYPLGFAGLVSLEFIQALIPLGTAWIIKVLFDLLSQGIRGEVPTALPQALLFLLAAQATLNILSQTIMPVMTYLNGELGRSLTLNTQLMIYRKINSLVGLAPFENPQFYDTIQLAASGAQTGPSQAISTFTALLRGIVTTLSFLGILVALDPLLAGIVTLAVLPQLYAHLKLSRQRYDLAFGNSPRQRRASYIGFILSGIPFAKEVRLFNLADYFLDRYRRTYEEIHAAERNQHRTTLRWHIVLNVLASLVGSGAFVLVILQAFAGRISVGDVTLYTSAVVSVQAALAGIAYALANVNESVLFYNQFINLQELPQTLPLAAAPRPVPPLQHQIELRDLSFRYSAEHPWVLRNVNLVLPAKKCLALVGLNGAGKTTLVKLLTRCYDPTGGQILWDGIDIRAFDPQELRRHIGAIFQDFVRFDLTAQENIGVGDVAHLEDHTRVREAAIKTGVHPVIEALPQGYQTILSRWLAENGLGVDLSGGEWQKLAMARMFMRQADLLILDEPTAALDAQAEYDLYSHFVELMAGRTTLLITHRFSTVRMADVVAVLEHGEITEYGTHAELMILEGTYARLYRMQAERYI